MAIPLRVLIINDSENDTRLIANELQRGGFDPLLERVNSPETVKVALGQKTWDVVISNFVMSKCTALEALSLLQEKNLDLPFIIVSDIMSEDIALQCLKAGIHAFFKKKNIKLLVPAVERGLREVTIKRERNQAEKSLRQSEDRFRQVGDNLGEWIWEVDTDGLYTYSSHILEKILGYKPEEVVGKIHFYDLFVPEKREELKKVAFKVFAGKERFKGFVNRNLHKNGTVVILETSGAPILDQQGRLLGYRGADTDITERKQAEEALRKSQLQQKALLDNIPDAAWLKDKESRFIAVNEALIQLSGYRAAEVLVGKTDFEIWPKKLAETYRSEDQEVILTKKRKIIEQSFVSPSGKITWVEKIKTPILNEKNEVIGTVGISRNITQHKQTEQALRENEKKYQSLYQEFQGILNAIPDILCLISSDLKIVWANKRSAELFNKNRLDIIGKYCYQVWHNRTEPCKICPAQRSFHSRMPEFEEVSSFDGRIWELRVVPIIEDQSEVKGVVELARDISQKKTAAQEMSSLQEQLRQAQKMEAIGRLAGGVAHDFNNLLTVIQVNTEISLRELRKDDPLRSKLEEVRNATERAANLTRQLLAFSRRQVLNLKVFDLNFILTDLEKMLHRIIGEEVELVTAFADDLGRVKADPGEIEQVIINLAVNAKDAMPHGGILTIETANAELDKEYARTHVSILPGSYVMVSITDTGGGMTKEIQEQIFDPFFTTKEKGKGTGLGLSTVYGIIKQSGGDIQVYSEPGKGTTFKLYLPRVDEPLEVLEEKGLAEEIPRGNETILIVEDDSAVRKIAVQVLIKQGYNVLVAESGGDAFLICEREKNPIHLVLTDVVMPKMSGPELIERLQKIRKDFRVLYMSGYTEKKVLKGLDKEFSFLQKPFTIEALAKKVREVLKG